MRHLDIKGYDQIQAIQEQEQAALMLEMKPITDWEFMFAGVLIEATVTTRVAWWAVVLGPMPDEW